MAASHSYLKKRKKGWYVQLAIPRAAQATLGCKTIARSLKTRDEVEAHRLKHAVIAEIQSTIRQALAVTPAQSQQVTPDHLLSSALDAQKALEEGRASKRDVYAAHDAAVDDFLEAQARLVGVGPDGHPLLPSSVSSVIKRSYGALAGRHDLSLSHLVSVYLTEQEGRLTAQTVGDKRRRLEAFLKWFGAERECSEVTRKVAGTYVTEVVQRRVLQGSDEENTPLSAKTRGKETSDLRSFFQWLSDRGRIDENPFDRMARSIKESSRAEPETRRAWKPEELSEVIRGVDHNDPLWSLAVIAAYTGMRREEVGELEVTSVDGDTFQIERGKTKAANRRVAIHPVIAPLVAQLVSTSTDGYLIPGLLRGGPDKKRSWYVGKRFGRVIRKLGITDTKLDFHALRGTVVNQMEESGVPHSTIQLIVGHRRQGVTFGSYSAEGVSDKVRRAALGKVSYGQLDTYVKRIGSTVVVKASASPKKKN